MSIPRPLLPLLIVLLAPACAAFGSSAGSAPMRSPSLDYAQAPVETADGQILGADGVPPEDKLRQSPRVGSGGVTPADVPATIEKRRPEPRDQIEDPLCNGLAMNDAARIERCPAHARPNP